MNLLNKSLLVASAYEGWAYEIFKKSNSLLFMEQIQLLDFH